MPDRYALTGLARALLACHWFPALSPERYKALRPDARKAVDDMVHLLEQIEEDRMTRAMSRARLM